MKRNILLAFSFVLMVISLFLVFVWVPTERVMGVVQRIFYLMVPVGWLALLSFSVVFICSILYLAKKQNKWDIISRSSAEIGIICTTLALVVGSLWAKPIWGVWWTWEARLTGTLVLWLVYIAYFMARSFATEESRGARFAAVIGIIGFIDIPIIALATTLWRGLHPPPLIFEQGGLAPSMLLTLIVSIVSFTLLFFVLLVLRVNMANNEDDIKHLREQIG